MNRLVLLISLLISTFGFAQSTFSGQVLDENGAPLSGVNIYLKGTFLGGSSDKEGRFSIEDVKPGATAVFSMLGFESHELMLSEKELKAPITLVLKEAFDQLKAVTVSAGSMEVSDEKQSVVLKPLDIVTTAGALGDVVGALKTLPGTATNANDGRLFVRGGAANETALFIDGLRIGNAFGSSLNGIPTRSRFSPQLFKGSFFSTGAYSAEYGQALSSVLSLNSLDFPIRRQTDLSLLTVGAGVSHTEVWERQALTANLNYTNLEPYMALIPQNVRFSKAPQGIGSEFLFRQKVSKRGLLKVFYAFQNSELGVIRRPLGEDQDQHTQLKNNFHHLNLNYRQNLGKKHLLDGGISYSDNRDDIDLNGLIVAQDQQLLHAKLRHRYFATARLNLKYGGEVFAQNYREGLGSDFRKQEQIQTALFAEGDYYFNSDLVVKVGLRAEAAEGDLTLNPRASLAYRPAAKSSVSLAYGQYRQDPELAQKMLQPELTAAEAQHWVLNYLFSDEARTFRAELYHKQYRNLLWSFPDLHSGGKGYARGFDLFWRDRQGVANLDYWISYSFVDSRRNWRSFESLVQPSFAPRHNASLVGKYWIARLNSQLGGSFNLNDGYTYDNPNKEGEMESRTKAFSSLNLSWSYLPQPNLIIHFEVTNVLGRENVMGHQFSNLPNQQGQFASRPIAQSAKRFVLLGIFYTLSADKKANQLNNL